MRARILHVIASMDPEGGGTTQAVRTLLDFAPEGYACEVVSLDEPDAGWVKDFPYPLHLMGPRGSTYGHSEKLKAWLTANRERFDGVMLHGLWTYTGKATWQVFGGRKPYLVFPHGMLDPYFKRAFPFKHLKKWVYWLAAEFWVLRAACRVLFTTSEESRLAEETFSLHQWKGVVIPFGADRPPNDGETLRETYFAAFPQMRGKRFVLYLGRIHRKKGCDMLLEAFARASASDPRLELVMAGPDQQGWSAKLQESVARAGLSARVHWPGMLTGDVKWGAFFASEVFVLPSHQENFGIAVAEAMACGRAVLLADKVNIAAEIAGDGAGLMEADTQAGTDALLSKWIAMSAEAKSAMGQKALETFGRRYDMRGNTAAIYHLFDEVIAAQQEQG